MFSTFPDGCAGCGLLLLRAAAGSGLIVQGVAGFAGSRELGFLSSAVAVVTLVAGALVLLGCLTRMAAAIAMIVCLFSVFSWFPSPHVGLFENATTATLAAVIATALVCLGPGAFSLDSKLFGRREVIIPGSSSTDV